MQNFKKNKAAQVRRICKMGRIYINYEKSVLFLLIIESSIKTSFAANCINLCV